MKLHVENLTSQEVKINRRLNENQILDSEEFSVILESKIYLGRADGGNSATQNCRPVPSNMGFFNCKPQCRASALAAAESICLARLSGTLLLIATP